MIDDTSIRMREARAMLEETRERNERIRRRNSMVLLFIGCLPVVGTFVLLGGALIFGGR